MADPSVESVCDGVEAASRAFLGASSQAERAAAEAHLLGFRRSENPLAACRQLLARSSLGYAQLQAL